MNIVDIKEKLIFCHICKQPVEFGRDTYFFDRDVRCLIDDDDKNKGAHLGFEWDLPKEWMHSDDESS